MLLERLTQRYCFDFVELTQMILNKCLQSDGNYNLIDLRHTAQISLVFPPMEWNSIFSL